MSLFLWSTTAANNASADPSVNFAEGQTPGSVNDSCRQLMKSVAEWRDDTNGSLVLGGGTTAYTLSTNQTFTSLTDGLLVAFEVNSTNTDAVTLNVDSLGAKDLITSTGNALVAGDLAAGGKYHACFDSSADDWVLLNYTPQVTEIASGTLMLFVQTSAPTGWTKNTSHNDKALRIVSGTASTGGTVDFTTAFASQSVAGTVGNTAITEAQLPEVTVQAPTYVRSDEGPTASGVDMDDYSETSIRLQDEGHTFGSESTGRILGGVDINFGSGDTHTHTFSGTAIDLAVKYVDCIIAQKD